MAHSLFAYGFLGKAVKKGLLLAKSGESLNSAQKGAADFPPLPSFLPWLRPGQQLPAQGSNFPSNDCSRKIFFQALELKVSDFFFPSNLRLYFFQLHLCKFGLVWDTIDKHNVKAIPAKPGILRTNYEKT